ncbi:hypothetical protein BCT55_10280 [Vibrio splendidus]|uniref:DUF2798 domain-containing protein n=1 Tax=Vibrio splendidus TaxID=29497 RepID=UPI000C833706|nr:DUF2798 domain-containing protein [Vibrio splendidus]MBU2908028.1 DUF2798 domain-containing protein [Vibrio splendidus]MDO6530029.1 DUF2798 domain-containing protein [Vibrio splendidus]MDO6551084.1 DUF2798 domain-containing protein [Vibrio splendidus]PMM37020.1 hypothetical protein BCT55_10280 [Vibrio splendidus]RIH73324.1 hypothetical protein BJG01_04295 [Vibrio splendidus]
MTIQATLTPTLPEQKGTPVLYKILVMMSLMLTIGGSLTAVMTYMNVGFGEAFIGNWLSSLALVVVIMMPIGVVMMTLVTKLVAKVLPNNGEKARNLVVGLIMAFIMESIMAFVTAANNIGFSDTSAFTSGWFNGFITALPVGLTIMVVMSMTVKPKLERFMKS